MMAGVAGKYGREAWCVFSFSAVLLVMFYWAASPADNLPLLRSGISIQQYNWQTESVLMPIHSRPVKGQLLQPIKVAICLVGGLRAFELTGPSIKKYLLDVYDNADVFIHAPIDEDVHKLSLLSGAPHLASVKLFTPTKLNETWYAQQVLTASGSPNGIQGLLQYFNLVEGCWHLMEDYEAKHNFKYDWVIRSRVDGYWNGPMLPLGSFNASKYYVPYGSHFGGLNDRLGVGTRETSRIALQRMSLLPEIYQLGYRHINSETSFKAQFKTGHVEVELNRFPFCVLSKRKYKWPIGLQGIPVASIMSNGPLNGAKCRPCTPNLVGELARQKLNESRTSAGAIGPTDDAQLCNAQWSWEKNWEQIYDKVTGPEMAEIRQRIPSRSPNECIRDLKLFQKQWKFWNAPSAEDICEKRKPQNETAPS